MFKRNQTASAKRPARLIAFLLAALMVPLALGAQQRAKTVEGHVLDGGSAPLAGAIVYLQDQKTNVIKTLIARADGSFRFTQLPADTDYTLWSEYKGKKSKNKLISSFDTKMDVNEDFHISQ